MVSDEVIEAFMAEVRDTSLRAKQHQLHRNTTIIWNEIVASLPDLGLTKLSVPASHRKYTRVKWDQLSQGLRQDTDAYLMWCAKEDLFVPDAREHALTPRTIENIRVFINAAATALIQRGVPASSINGLADLVTLEAFSAILNHRYEAVGRKENQYNVGLAFALSQIAEHWVKVDSAHLTELKRRASKLPQKTVGQMTERNRRQLHQFDDPEVRDRLDGLPDRLWREVRREAKPNWHTLVQAQAAIAIGVLNNAPIRLQNLTSLEFDRHLFLREGKDAISTCEFTAEEVKNEVHLAFDLPPPIAKMLIEYRDVLVPKVLGYRPDFVFINKNGSLKKEASVRQLIQTNLSRHVGIEFHPHAFRHLAGKILLDDNPGGHELVRQFLGHKRIQTTVNYYTGVDTRRAGRHFQNLLAKARLERSRPMRRERKADARGRRAAGE
jgi:integrase